MKLTYIPFELKRYFQLHPIHSYSRIQWTFHYLGMLRIVYNTEIQSWEILPNIYNPLTFLAAFFVVTFVVLWKGVSSFSKSDLKFLIELWEKREDGSYKCIPYNRAPRLPLDPSTHESLKKRKWVKPYLN